MTLATVLPFFAGFGLGGSLIVAIGAQNAFVLKQGLRKHSVLPIVLVCVLSDTALIWLGAYAMSAAAEKITAFASIARFGGAAFLFVYGVRAAWNAVSNQAMETSGQGEANLSRAILICLGFTLLNPHVYLDTVVLIGSVAAQYQAADKLVFCLGATSASVIWFFALGYGARLLTPIFAKPIAWRVLDATIALIMLTLSVEIASGL